MKIRIKGNSVRIRLSKPETKLFAVKGYLEERTGFGKNTFIYSVKSTEDKNMSAEFVNGNIIVYIPQHLLKQWSSTSLVGLEYQMPVSNGEFLNILLEKDFKCIDNATEDQSDYFENPAKFC